MERLQIYLFGKFGARRGEQDLAGLESQKVRELFCYLLIHRRRPHTREKLADLLWPKSTAAQAKQYFRQTLYQLQSALEETNERDSTLISVESDWIRVNPDSDYWSDIRQFERTFALTQNRSGQEMSATEARALESAVTLYRGALLENWYQDWSILERERVQDLYLIMVDKLIGHCLALGEYERGIHYGLEVLRCDVAHERTYRRLMRLHALAGDRTGALRQYERCVTVLAQELDVPPAKRTVTLYEQIRGDHTLSPFLHRSQTHGQVEASVSLTSALDRLNHVKMDLIDVVRQVEERIERVETALADQH